MNKFLWFLIFLVLGCTVVWLLGAFISWNLTWFLDTVIGRILAAIAFIAAIYGAIENADEM